MEVVRERRVLIHEALILIMGIRLIRTRATVLLIEVARALSKRHLIMLTPGLHMEDLLHRLLILLRMDLPPIPIQVLSPVIHLIPLV